VRVNHIYIAPSGRGDQHAKRKTRRRRAGVRANSTARNILHIRSVRRPVITARACREGSTACRAIDSRTYPNGARGKTPKTGCQLISGSRIKTLQNAEVRALYDMTLLDRTTKPVSRWPNLGQIEPSLFDTRDGNSARRGLYQIRKEERN
jgi:hypothetical protein